MCLKQINIKTWSERKRHLQCIFKYSNWSEWKIYSILVAIVKHKIICIYAKYIKFNPTDFGDRNNTKEMIAMVNAMILTTIVHAHMYKHTWQSPLRKSVSLYDKREKKPLEFVTFYLK